MISSNTGNDWFRINKHQSTKAANVPCRFEVWVEGKLFLDIVNHKDLRDYDVLNRIRDAIRQHISAGKQFEVYKIVRSKFRDRDLCD